MRQALELALEALKENVHELIAENKALKKSLAQPERDYERGFIDGMQKQMQSSVDKAVNLMAQLDQDEVDIRSRLYQRIHELETQLAQPEQEPVYTARQRPSFRYGEHPTSFGLFNPKQSPLTLEWVGLTIEDVKVIEDNAPSKQMAIFMAEATLKEKNNG